MGQKTCASDRDSRQGAGRTLSDTVPFPTKSQARNGLFTPLSVRLYVIERLLSIVWQERPWKIRQVLSRIGMNAAPLHVSTRTGNNVGGLG